MVKVKVLEVESEILASLYGKDGLHKIVETFLNGIENKFVNQRKAIDQSIENIFIEEDEDEDEIITTSTPGMEKSPLDDDDDDEDDDDKK